MVYIDDTDIGNAYGREYIPINLRVLILEDRKILEGPNLEPNKWKSGI